MSNFAYKLHSNNQQIDAALKRYLLIFLKKDVSILIKAIRYSILSKGKRLRPFLVYQTGKLFGIKSSKLDAPAAAIECIHNYSLIHDDLPSMDNDVLRRNQPTCHIKFGEAIAILTGDALHTLAFTILSEANIPTITHQDRLKMISTLADASGANGICSGQCLDIINKNNKDVSSTLLNTICQYKTGSLIRAAVRIGALAAGHKSYNALVPLDQYAKTIGLAFQIQDDIVDNPHYNTSNKKQQTTQIKNYKNKINNCSESLRFNTTHSTIKKLYYKSLVSLKYIAKLGYNVNTLSAFARYVTKRIH